MHTISNIEIKNKRVLVRVDFNVPLNAQFEVADTTRIRAALPTLKYILNQGGSLVLMSHLGRPKTGPNTKYSLKHIVPCLEALLEHKIQFVEDCISGDAFEITKSLKPGNVILLENLRFYTQEERGDVDFAKQLSRHGDIYINDAFGTAHREHASTAVIARFFNTAHKALGLLMSAEVESISKVLNFAEKPLTAIIGGAKVSDKILIIQQLMNRAQHIIIGGGMAFTFIKAMGGATGASLCEKDRLDTALELINLAKQKGVQLHLPSDACIADAFDQNANTQLVSSFEIPDLWMGLDIGPKSMDAFARVIQNSKTILWNGPMGVFEMSAFETGTRVIAEAIVKATQAGAYSLIGGGDSVAAINKYQLSSMVSYVSTGGGALLEFIEQGTLPGVDAINFQS